VSSPSVSASACSLVAQYELRPIVERRELSLSRDRVQHSRRLEMHHYEDEDEDEDEDKDVVAAKPEITHRE
jgi:hypothetical protein